MRMRCGAKTCVEINQCVGCTKSFLGDDAAVLARSSVEEPAPPRHRTGVASMAWRRTRRSGRTRRKFDFHTGKDYEYAWCVEHDVALTGGNWLGFYEAHASDVRDLLAWRVGWVPKDAKPHKGGAWNAGMMTGPRFDCFQNGRGAGPSARATAATPRSRFCSGRSCVTPQDSRPY